MSRSAAVPSAGGVNKGETVTVTVLEVRDGGLEVQVGDDGATGFIKRTDLGRDRDEQRPERFQVGQKFDAQVIGFDRSKKPNFSIKALQISEEKQAVAQYGSSDARRVARRHPRRGAEGKGEPQAKKIRSKSLRVGDFVPLRYEKGGARVQRCICALFLWRTG